MSLKYTTKEYELSSLRNYDKKFISSDNLGDTEKALSKDATECQSKTENKLNYCSYLRSLTAYERHKIFINNYFLTNAHAFALLKRDESRDKRDIDIIHENHQFLWDTDESLNSWGKQLAKKYYDKLFKEYCICDLSKYKEDQVGMRWRTEKEVKDGKGQFICGEKRCSEINKLRTWEMNFGYMEKGVKKNALVKLRLCHTCSYKVNYKHKRKEIKLNKKKKSRRKHSLEDIGKTGSTAASAVEPKESDITLSQAEGEQNIWKGPTRIMETQDQEEEFEEYLEDLFL